MENFEKELTPEESLKLISQVIIDTRRNFKHTNFFILLWGWIVVIASLACFFLIQYLCSTHQYEYINLWCWIVWGGTTAIGIAIQIFYLRKINRQTQTKSQFVLIIRALWYVSFVAIALSSFMAYKLGFYPAPIIFIVIGLSAFVTGYIIKFRPLMYGAALFGISSVVSVYIRGDYQLLVVAIAIVFGYLIPGYMLKFGNGKN